jgi:hypothetical protein
MDVDAILDEAVNSVTDSDLYLVEHDGLGDLPVVRLEQSGPLQHGATDLGWRGVKRTFTLAFDFSGNASERYTERARLRRLFAPHVDLALRFTLPDGSTERQIDCTRADAPLPVSGDGFQGRFVYRFQGGPAFYDPSLNTVTFGTSDSSTGTAVPTEVPTNIGASVISGSNTIAYGGDFPSWPKQIKITGPITDCVITNEETGDKLDFSGVTIGAGEYYVIDTRYGYKTVEDSSGNNKIDDLTDDSDLANFRLVPAEDGTTSRDNEITVEGKGATASTEVEIKYYDYYGGI